MENLGVRGIQRLPGKEESLVGKILGEVVVFVLSLNVYIFQALSNTVVGSEVFGFFTEFLMAQLFSSPCSTY